MTVERCTGNAEAYRIAAAMSTDPLQRAYNVAWAEWWEAMAMECTGNA